jgi:long-chain acyl-CoA synthetase
MTAEPRTLNEVFNLAVARFRDDEFLRFKRGGVWQSLTYGEVARRVGELALGLIQHGIERGDRIAIWSENRPEWNMADLAALATGAVDVPIYTTQSPGRIHSQRFGGAGHLRFGPVPWQASRVEATTAVA